MVSKVITNRNTVLYSRWLLPTWPDKVGYCQKSVIFSIILTYDRLTGMYQIQIRNTDIHLGETCTHSNFLFPFGQRLVATPENSGYEMNFQETAISGSIFAEIVWTHLLLKKYLSKHPGDITWWIDTTIQLVPVRKHQLFSLETFFSFIH